MRPRRHHKQHDCVSQSRPLIALDLDLDLDFDLDLDLDLETLREVEDGHRYELIDGSLIVTPAPVPKHQVVAFA